MSFDPLLRHGSISELDISPAPSRSISPVPPAYISPKASSEKLFTPDFYPYPAAQSYDREAERREERARAIRERICEQLDCEKDVEKGVDGRAGSSLSFIKPLKKNGLGAYVAPALVTFAILGILVLVIALSIFLRKGGH